MPPISFIDLTGQRFGKQVVLNRITDTCDKKYKERTYWLCKCDCGKFNECRTDGLRSGMSKSCGCTWSPPKHGPGPTHPNWKSGKHVSSTGYIRVRANGKYQQEHRLIIEGLIGRKLSSYETIHHKNGIRSDNSLENLELRSSNHGQGARIEDLVEHWTNMLKIYAPERLSEGTPA